MLDKIIDGYTSIVVTFYRWFGKQQASLHRGAMQELAELQSRLKKVLGEE